MPRRDRCRKCREDLGEDGDYIARLCVDCVYEEDEEE